MNIYNRQSISIPFVIIIFSLLTWIILLFNPGNIMTIEHCHVSIAGPSSTSLNMLLAMNPFSSQLIGWGLMVLAMMLPKLIIPIQSIYSRSFRKYRLICSTFFVFGYLLLWMAVGVVMISIIIGFNLLLPMSYLPALIVFLIAVFWQFSPIKQHFLNLGHNHGTVSAFGIKSIVDSYKSGILHGVWCVGSGWALMLFPMLLPKGHNFTMLIVTFVMISEHMEHPKYPKWDFDLRLKLLRLMVAQTKIRLKRNN